VSTKAAAPKHSEGGLTQPPALRPAGQPDREGCACFGRQAIDRRRTNVERNKGGTAPPLSIGRFRQVRI
jgi:hypothetical protein